MKKWPGTLTREQAIKIIDRATDRDDPHWDGVCEDFYDEKTDTMPTIYQVMEALGVPEAEFKAVTGED